MVFSGKSPKVSLGKHFAASEKKSGKSIEKLQDDEKSSTSLLDMGGKFFFSWGSSTTTSGLNQPPERVDETCTTTTPEGDAYLYLGSLKDLCLLEAALKATQEEEGLEVEMKSEVEMEEMETIQRELQDVRQLRCEVEQLLSEQHQVVAWLCKKDEQCGGQRHKIIVEMKPVLRLEAQRQSLLNDEASLNKLLALLQNEQDVSKEYCRLELATLINELTSNSVTAADDSSKDCCHPAVLSNSKAMYKQAQARAQAVHATSR